MASYIHISLILATLITQMSSSDQDKCRKAMQDLVKVVKSCPRSRKEWDIAASKKNCELPTLCMTSKEPYLYHCVINGFRNETLEVCAPRRIIFGHCTEYNVAGGVIQRQKSAKCNNVFPKCDKSYNSTEAYKCSLKDNIKTTTSTVPSEEKTTTSKPDYGINPKGDVLIGAVVIICGLIVLFVRLYMYKKHGRRTLMDVEEQLIENAQDAASQPSIRHLFLKTKHFPHFKYVCNLAKDCKLRIENVITDGDWENCMFDNIIKFGIAGKFTDDNINLLSKGKGINKRRGTDEQHMGEAALICFQNDLSSKLALEILQKENAYHKILIQSEDSCDKTKRSEASESVIIVGQNKQQIKETITTCLEKQLDKVLQEWLGKLQHVGLNNQTPEIIAEIEAIRKQLITDTSINAHSPDVPCNDSKSIVPVDVKDYLLGRSDVQSFGIWGCSTFKIFVNKAIDDKILESELIVLDQNFFEKYHLKIERRIMVEKQTMRHYDSTSLHYNFEEKFPKAFTKQYDETKKHENNCALIDDSLKCKLISHCLYPATGFHACEIKEPFLDTWTGTTKIYGKQKANMPASIRGPESDDNVQKIRDSTDTYNAQKSIISPESLVHVFTQELASMFLSYFYFL